MQQIAAALAAAVALALAPAPPLPGQQPTPGPGSAPVSVLARHGAELLEQEDPVRAWDVFREVRGREPAGLEGLLGLARVHLLLGNAVIAIAYASAALLVEPGCQDAMAVQVRSLIRDRLFEQAVETSGHQVALVQAPSAHLLAARASALFRVQRIDDAANVYRQVLAADPLDGEAHLRLGSGLLPPAPATVGPELLRAVQQSRRGDGKAAVAELRALLLKEPDHPIAHRLLGEVLWQIHADASMANSEPAFARLRAVLPSPDLGSAPVGEFVTGYTDLSPARRLVADRALSLFARHLGRLVAIGGRHDLLLETERTTDAPSRGALRGKRTFDGRVWDDVRGIGGLLAATGIEALDEAMAFGFDTLAHELAHQVHYYAVTQVDRMRIHELYQQARQHDRCLDHYAASNEAEYFGQGVEAFACYGKRPGCETTHGLTRFELYRRDRELHDFIAALVDRDPLADPVLRARILPAAVEVLLVCGRGEDAVVAAEMLGEGAQKQELLQKAMRAQKLWRSY